MGSSPGEETVRRLVEPVVTNAGFELVDCELKPGLLRVSVDQPGGAAADRLGELSRAVSHALDAADPIPARYTLEVSSPGVERPLRTPAHFRRAVGATVAVRTRPDVPGDRRTQGRLVHADDTGISVAVPVADTGEETLREFSYADIDRARTVFEWGPAPRPGAPKTKAPKTTRKAAS